MGLDGYFSDVLTVFHDYAFIRYAGAFLLGLCLGSFSSAVAYRAPRGLSWAYERKRDSGHAPHNNHQRNSSNAADAAAEGQGCTSSPRVRVFEALRGWTPVRSMCPACKTILTGRDLVPVLSWVLARGRCRHCGVPVSVRYPLLELFAGVAALAIMALADMAGEGVNGIEIGYSGVAVLLMMLPFVMALFMALRENGRLSWKIMFIIITLFVVLLGVLRSNL